MKRFSAFVHAFGRRSIPKHWNERFQDKENAFITTVARRLQNNKVREKNKNDVRSFRGDWEDFLHIVKPKSFRNIN